MGSIQQQPSTKRLISPSDLQSLPTLHPTITFHTPSSPLYSKSIERWSHAAEKPAGLVAVPTSSIDVAKLLVYARDHNLDLAIKGGGHSTAGASSTDGGLLIDLSQMTTVRVDAEAKLAYVGGGATWGMVDIETWKYGLATVGGTVADTGVGGLALGGGYGWLSGRYGLTVDCLMEVEMVTSDGRVLRVNEKENADLFWGVLGAGQNFGVVAEFVIKLFEQGPIWGGLLAFPNTPEYRTSVVAAINSVFRHSLDDADPHKVKYAGRMMGALVFARPPPTFDTMLLVAALFNGPEDEAKLAWGPVLKCNPVADMTGVHPYPAANTLLAPPPGDIRSSMKGCGFVLPIREEFVTKMGEEFDTFTGQEPDGARGMIMWEIFDPEQVVKRQDVGFFANRGWHFNGLVCPIWSDPSNDAKYRQWARDLSVMWYEELGRQGREHGTSVEGGAQARGPKGAVILYGNYDQHDERAKDIFGINYERLQRLKAEYDPTNVFNRLFAITPLQA